MDGLHIEEAQPAYPIDAAWRACLQLRAWQAGSALLAFYNAERPRDGEVVPGEPDPSLPLPAAIISPAKTERTLASTHCFSFSVMMPASRRQLALKDMKQAEGASLIGKISLRFTGDFMALRL
jgi:hypothetical protein